MRSTDEISDLDISQWAYRAEGNHSLVLSNFQNETVLRLLKKSSRRNVNQQRNIKLTKQYVDEVIAPLLGDPFVKHGVIVDLPKGFVEDVNCRFFHSRPAYRRNKEVDADCEYGLCFPDFCVLPLSSSHQNTAQITTPPTFCVEIKPKEGYICFPRSISQEELLKRDFCQYCLQKPYKVKLRKQKVINDYCPLDLFSGNQKCMKHALKELFRIPQNNLRIFQDRREILSSECQIDMEILLKSYFGSDDYHCDINKESATDCFIEILVKSLLHEPSSQELSPFQTSQMMTDEYVYTCQNSLLKKLNDQPRGATWMPSLPPNCVLSRILSLQMLDNLGIEGLFPCYERVIKYFKKYPDERKRLCIDGPYDKGIWSSSTKLTDNDLLNFSLNKVRDYLLAVTLKHCSIMIAVQPVKKEKPCTHNIVIEHFGQQFAVAVSVIDLDPKCFDKIPTYLQLDREIVAYYHMWLQEKQ